MKAIEQFSCDTVSNAQALNGSNVLASVHVGDKHDRLND